LRRIVSPVAGVKVPVRKLVHTEAKNRERAEIVKEALANNWIHAPRDAFGPNGTCLLEQEMKFLQLRNLRLIKPTTGPWEQTILGRPSQPLRANS
jgi:hypothetical protein